MFKGTQTHHMVDKSNDPNTIRWMLGFQYIEQGALPEEKSFCSEFRGQTTVGIVREIWWRYVFMIFVVYLSKTKLPQLIVTRKLYYLVCVLPIMLSFVLPYFSHYNSGIVAIVKSTISVLLIYSFAYLDFEVAIGFYSYLLMTESLFR